MKCPVCAHPLEVEAASEDEAMTKMMEMAKSHMSSVHPDMEMKTDEEMHQMVMDGWTKTEAGAAAEETPAAGGAM